MSEQLGEPFDFPKELRCDSVMLKNSHPYTADLLWRAAAEFDRLRSQLAESDAEIDSLSLVSPQQYQKEIAELRAQLASREENIARIKVQRNNALLDMERFMNQLVKKDAALKAITELWSGGSMFHAHEIARGALTDEKRGE